ncbi:MAG: hypothetical protein WA902_16530 [Thermosynechococcaceae cyanobacterium]
MVDLSKFLPYLKSILDVSRQDGDRCDRYIPTQAELPLRVQVCDLSPTEQAKNEKKREQFSVLKGVRKYAPEHVLLVGKPGSGKSTALQRLRWQDTECCIQALLLPKFRKSKP